MHTLVHMHTHMHTQTHTHMHTHKRTHTCIHTNAHTHTNRTLCLITCTCTCTCTAFLPCPLSHVYMYTPCMRYMYIHAHHKMLLSLLPMQPLSHKPHTSSEALPSLAFQEILCDPFWRYHKRICHVRAGLPASSRSWRSYHDDASCAAQRWVIELP